MNLPSNFSFPDINKMPKVIWQTYISESLLPVESMACRRSWSEKNPDWCLRFCDDGEMRRLFETHLREFLPIFDILPHGVMKADMWRYAVIYIHGGFYCDIDTSCNKSLNDWILPSEKTLLHVACENNHPFFCQWAFGAPASHPLLLEVLNLIASRVDSEGIVDTRKKDYVHYYTGPGVWTDAIRSYLKSSLLPKDIQKTFKLEELSGLRIYPEPEFSWGRISHSFASFNWRDTGYSSWQDQRHDSDQLGREDEFDQVKGIPQIVHQTWKHEISALPHLVKRCVHSVRAINPTWDCRYYTDDDLMEVVKTQEHLSADNFYKVGTGIEKSDIFRCAVLYTQGGVYCDVDIEAIRPFDDLISRAVEEGLCGPEVEILLTLDHPLHNEKLHRREMVMNHFMIAKKGSRFLALILIELNRMLEDNQLNHAGDAVNSTGPGFFTRLIEQNGGAKSLGIGIMPFEWIHPLPDMAWNFDEMKPYEEMIIAGSWCSHFNPYTSHYWWHNYCSAYSNFDKYGDHLFDCRS